jgi:hypothetical protein
MATWFSTLVDSSFCRLNPRGATNQETSDQTLLQSQNQSNMITFLCLDKLKASLAYDIWEGNLNLQGKKQTALFYILSLKTKKQLTTTRIQQKK